MSGKHYNAITLEKPSRRVTGWTVRLDGSLDEPVLDIMARCIQDAPWIGELSEMNSLLYRLSDLGYELVKVDET